MMDLKHCKFITGCSSLVGLSPWMSFQGHGYKKVLFNDKSCPEMGGHSWNHKHRAVTKWKYTGLD